MIVPRTAAIVNPRSGGTASRWPEIARRLPGVETRFTERPRHAEQLARELLREGFERIVAVGGDGTLNEVLNGFFENGEAVNREASLALIPFGTGGDFRRTAGLRSVEDALRALTNGAPRLIDVGRLRYRERSGATASRYFLNVTSFGMGGEVAARAKNVLTTVGGKTAFFYATLEVFLRYRPKTVTLELDGQILPAPYTILNIAIGNGRYHGGGMHVCPRASFEDGLLDITVIESLNAFELARDIRLLYSDNLYVHPKTHHFRARRVTARSAEDVSIEVDGEPLGLLPLEAEIVPAALRLWGA